jgi:hypothetical protein
MNKWINSALRRSIVVGVAVCAGAALAACSPAGIDSPVDTGGGKPSTGGATTTGGTGAAVGGKADTGPSLGGSIATELPGGPCEGLECKVATCTPDTPTTISGKVYAPNGTLPLYNVLVYVPNGPVLPFTEGASCDRCGASVTNPVTSAITDETGSFKLVGAPTGENIPLVIQVGKWRRQIVVPTVTSCVDTPLTDPQLTRLPKNKTEGDIPRIAISVGGADQMECLPLRLGIDPAEFTTSAGDGRIHLSLGHNNENGMNQPVRVFDTTLNAGAELTSSDALWASAESLLKYDIVILSCEGDSFERDKPLAVRQAMYDYASKGGRVFASHWHNVWFEQGPDPLPTTGTWETRMPNPAGNEQNQNGDDTPVPATINQAFPKGAALAQWLLNVGASTTLGNMSLVYPRDNIQAVNDQVAREWISVNNPNFPEAPKAVQYMSFNTPIGVPEEMVCGREVYTNLHVAVTDDNTGSNALGFPASCRGLELSAQEKAVAFMLFDLSACVMNDDFEPEPPK